MGLCEPSPPTKTSKIARCVPVCRGEEEARAHEYQNDLDTEIRSSGNWTPLCTMLYDMDELVPAGDGLVHA